GGRDRRGRRTDLRAPPLPWRPRVRRALPRRPFRRWSIPPLGGGRRTRAAPPRRPRSAPVPPPRPPPPRPPGRANPRRARPRRPRRRGGRPRPAVRRDRLTRIGRGAGTSAGTTPRIYGRAPVTEVCGHAARTRQA